LSNSKWFKLISKPYDLQQSYAKYDLSLKRQSTSKYFSEKILVITYPKPVLFWYDIHFSIGLKNEALSYKNTAMTHWRNLRNKTAIFHPKSKIKNLRGAYIFYYRLRMISITNRYHLSLPSNTQGSFLKCISMRPFLNVPSQCWLWGLSMCLEP
jgi:hypothetical protein